MGGGKDIKESMSTVSICSLYRNYVLIKSLNSTVFQSFYIFLHLDFCTNLSKLNSAVPLLLPGMDVQNKIVCEHLPGLTNEFGK